MSKTKRLPTFPTTGRGSLFLGTEEGQTIIEKMEKIVRLADYHDSRLLIATHLTHIFANMVNMHADGRCAPNIKFRIDESREIPGLPRNFFSTFTEGADAGDYKSMWKQVAHYLSSLLATHISADIKKDKAWRKSDQCEYRLLINKMQEALDLILDGEEITPPYLVEVCRHKDTWG